MYNRTILAGVAALALLTTACSEQTTAPPQALAPQMSHGDDDAHVAEGFTDVSAIVATIPEDAKVWRKQVEFANNLSGCSVMGIGSEYGGKIDESTSGTYVIPGTTIEVVLEVLGNNVYNISIQAGYVMTDIFLKQGGNPGEINQWYHFVPGVSEANGLVTIDNALSHFAVCADDAPTVILENLTVEKTADASYTRRVEWTLEKYVRALPDGEFGASVSFSGGPGSIFDFQWKVVATKTVEEEDFLVTGDITIHNPNPVSVLVSVADVLDDGTPGVVDCDDETEGAQDEVEVPAEGSATCSYTATPEDASATLNTATVEVLVYTPPANCADPCTIEGDEAEAEVEWDEELVGVESALLEDDRFEYSEEISETTTETFDEQYTCSSDTEDYDENGQYCEEIENTAELYADEDLIADATASVEITCSGLYGCTPGFWKQTFNYIYWTGIAPDDELQDIFDPAKIVNGLKTATAAQALDFGGGSGAEGAQRNLFRAAIASLLNLGHPDVAFSIPGLPAINTQQALIDHVNGVLGTTNSARGAMLALAEILDDANNAVNLCSLDAGRSIK